MVSLDINISLLIQIVNFLLIMVVLNYLLYRPLRKIISERKEKFSTLRTKAVEIKDKLNQDETKLRAIAVESTKLAMGEKHSIRAEGMVEQQLIIEEIQKEAAQELELSRKSLADSVGTARIALEKEIEQFAKEVAGKILGRSL